MYRNLKQKTGLPSGKREMHKREVMQGNLKDLGNYVKKNGQDKDHSALEKQD